MGHSKACRGSIEGNAGRTDEPLSQDADRRPDSPGVIYEADERAKAYRQAKDGAEQVGSAVLGCPVEGSVCGFN